MTPIQKIKAARRMILQFTKDQNPDYLPEIYTILGSCLNDLNESFEQTILEKFNKKN